MIRYSRNNEIANCGVSLYSFMKVPQKSQMEATCAARKIRKYPILSPTLLYPTLPYPYKSAAAELEIIL